MSDIIIALDGFSSCGKSSTAKRVAAALKYAFVDTGAMYRAVALYFHRNQISILDPNEIQGALSNIEISFVFNPERQASDTYLNGENIEAEIRKMYISDLVSQVSAVPVVRHAMVALQQKMGEKKALVMDGRDIGTVVFPKAELKIFMTADPEIRVDRRYKELLLQNKDITIDKVRENLAMRDFKDSSRADSPLRKAEDAIVLDNSYLHPDEQLELALSWAYEKINLKNNK